jgi:glycopeptide antibiotics resistance protein
MGSAAPGLLALLVGCVVAVVGFVPWVAVQYRRHGALRIGPTVLEFSILVYALAIMAYTLLPLPTDTAKMCLNGGPSPQTQLFGFADNIQRHGGYSGPASLLSNWAIAQVLFNILLFIPLGMFVRHAVRRSGTFTGVAVAAVAGLLVSLFVECTQLSGDWFLYPCAYRQFDVDDLLVNAFGAMLGAFLAPLLSGLSVRHTAASGAAQPVTAGRRLIGMVCDVLILGMTSGVLAVAVGVISFATGVDGLVGKLATLGYVLVLLPPMVPLVSVLCTGRTLGEAVVRLRPVSRPSAGQALVRWTLGIGGWSLMSNSDLFTVPSFVLAVVSTVCVWRTRGHRGLAYASAGLDVRDSRPTPAGPTPSPEDRMPAVPELPKRVSGALPSAHGG